MPAANASIEAGRAFVRLFAEDSQLQRGLRNALRSVRQFANGVQAIGRTLLSGGILGSFAVGFSAKGFADFEDQLLAIKGILNPTEAQFKAISDEAERLGRTTSFTALEVATAMADLARAGAQPDEIVGLMGDIINMARAAQSGLSDSSKIVISTMSQFELSLKRAVNISNILTAAANASTTDIEELGEALKYVGPIGKSVGFEFEQTAAALAILANAGLRGSVAGTQLARVMKQLGSSANRKILESRFNIDLAGDDANIEFIDILKRVGEEAKKLNKYERLGLFEDLFERGSVVAQILGKNADAFAEMVAQMENSDGTAASLAKTMESGLGGAIRRTLSAIDGVRLAFGRALSGSLKQFSDRLNGALNGLAKWIDRNQEVATSIVYTVQATLVLGGAMIALSASLRLVSFAAEGVLKALSLITGVVGLVVGAVASITTALFAIPLIGPALAAAFIGGLISGIDKAAGPLIAGFKRIQASAGAVFEAVIESLESGRIDAALGILAAAFDVTAQYIAGAFFDLLSPFQSVLAFLTEAFLGVMGTMQAATSDTWGAIVDISNAGGDSLADVWAVVADASAAAFRYISDAASTAWGFIMNSAGELADGVSIALAGVSVTWAKVTGDMTNSTASSARQMQGHYKGFFEFLGQGIRSVADFWSTAFQAVFDRNALYDTQKKIAQFIVFAKHASGYLSLSDFSEQMDALDTQFAQKKRDAANSEASDSINRAASAFDARLNDSEKTFSERLAARERQAFLDAEARRIELAKAQRALQNRMRGASANRIRELAAQRAKFDEAMRELKNETDRQREAITPLNLQAEGLKGGLQAVSFGGVNAELIFGKTNDIGKRQLDVAEKQLEELREIRKKQNKPGGVKGV